MHSDRFLEETAKVAKAIDAATIERLVGELNQLRERRGRLFLIGLGGSAANCSHMAADLRRLCEIDAHALTDSMAEFSAAANDGSLETSFVQMLAARKAGEGDALFVLSVGGGTTVVSRAITEALYNAQERGMRIYGIVGHRGGHTADFAHAVVKIPSVNDKHVTPHAEAFQAVIWHSLCCHPSLQRNATKW